MHELKINDTVLFTQKDRQYSGVISKIGKKNATVLIHETGEEKRIPIERIDYVPPVMLSTEEMRQLCRYEIKLSDLKKGHPDCANILFDEWYEITFEDLLAAMRNIKSSSNDSKTIIREWYSPICWNLIEEMDCIIYENTPEDVEMIEGLPTRQDCIEEILLSWLKSFLVESEESFVERIDCIINFINSVIENEKKPILDRNYTDDEKEKVINCFNNDDRLKKATEFELTVYRTFIDELCEKDNITALKSKGYGCYGGDPAYDCDWDTSLKCIQRLFELTGNPMYANTLGYIYYYGRCWNGEPKYEEAFKCFSVGAAGLYYESKYKLADMFLHGYGVPKNPNLAYTIVESLYDENLKYIMDGKFDCKFADIALRLGGYAEKGYAEYPNFPLAYIYYLQADFAIRQRLKYDYYGDALVAERIRNSLNTILESGNVQKPKKTAAINLKSFLYRYLRQYRKLQVGIKLLKNGVVKLALRIAPFKDEKYPPKLFITSYETGFCGMIETLNIKVKDAQIISTVDTDINEPIYFDGIDVIDADGREDIVFLLGDMVIGVIVGSFYFTSPTRTSGKKHKFASVYFTSGGKHYDYLLNIDDVAVGDTVFVMTDRGKTEVTVAAIFEKVESELPLPIGKYKKILDKSL